LWKLETAVRISNPTIGVEFWVIKKRKGDKKSWVYPFLNSFVGGEQTVNDE